MICIFAKDVNIVGVVDGHLQNRRDVRIDMLENKKNGISSV